MSGFEVHQYSPSLFSLLDAERLFVHLYGHSPNAFWLDSSRIVEGFSRYSVMGDASGPLAEIVRYRLDGRRIETESAGGNSSRSGDFFDYLESALASKNVEGLKDYSFPTGIGYVGCFGYELKALCGAAEAHVSDTPDAAFIFCDRAIVFDHLIQKLHLFCLSESKREAQAWFEKMEAELHRLPELAAPAEKKPMLEFTARHDRSSYLRMIERCQKHILDGDSYEICLTNRFTAEGDADALEIYRRLRRINPAPNAAYMRFGDMHILCSSPERFLHIDRNGRVESKPIKGTIKRGQTPEEDAALKLKLASSEKDKAENLMIVDLLRNDLGKVCETGSVHVPDLFAVETHAQVHHLVSTITGKLRNNVSALQCIRAAFPGGSMTGAPKLRTMEILDELEAGPRGIYSGALGYLALDGSADLNIVIRTAVVTTGKITIGSGGAITSESDPAGEWEELELKAAALKRVFV